MALKLRRGGLSGEASRARSYPLPGRTAGFGPRCVRRLPPAAVVARVEEGMRQALTLAERNSAVPSTVRRLMTQVWEEGGLS